MFLYYFEIDDTWVGIDGRENNLPIIWLMPLPYSH